MKKSLEYEVTTLRRQLGEIAEQLGKLTSRSAEEIGETVEDYAEELGSTAREKWQATGRVARQFGRKSQEFVESHPWQSIGMGVAVGFLIGFLAHKRE